MASVCVAYLLWLLGGWLGLHHFYLGRDRQAFVWWCLPGGYFGLGWLRDLWRIPDYVREANREEGWLTVQEEKERQEQVPPWKMARWGGMLVVGNMLGMLPGMAVPDKDQLGVDLTLLGTLLTPLGCGLGVWLVGNIGRWQGGLGRVLLGCYLTLPAYLYGMSVVSWTTIIGKTLATFTLILMTKLLKVFFLTTCHPRSLRLQTRVEERPQLQPETPGGQVTGASSLWGSLPVSLVLLPVLQRRDRQQW